MILILLFLLGNPVSFEHCDLCYKKGNYVKWPLQKDVLTNEDKGCLIVQCSLLQCNLVS